MTQFLISTECLVVFDLEDQVLSGPGGVLIDRKPHGVVPRRVRAGVLVDGGLLLGARVVGEVNDDVWVHLADEIDILEIFR